MSQAFDLVVVGTGSAGATVAGRCRAAGWRVAIVDSRPFGGTCALRGCDPKKVLVGATEALDWSQRMKGRGLRAAKAGIAWPELMRFKRSFTAPVPKAREEGFSKAGIVSFHGRARFVGPTSLRVDDELLEFKHVVIAAGMRPAPQKFPGAEFLTTSDQFLELPHLPRRLIFVGGGYISFEFAHIARRAGASVTILHRGAHALELFDPDLSDHLVQYTRKMGIRVLLGTEVVGVERRGKEISVRAATAGRPLKLTADGVVHGAGRVPDLDDLELDRANIERGPRGVTVNEFLQSTSNPAVYAAGDSAASGGPPLTPVAGYEGGVAAANLLEGNHLRTDYACIPSVVFTVPPLATVGLGEQAARAQNLRFRKNHQDTSGWYSSRRVGEPCSGFKVLVEEESDRILGAHLLGPQAEETINLFALAMRAGMRAAELRKVLFSYPTHASDIQYML